ncbi:MAG: SlyX family protein [Alphaproteobacteria bacterium]|nr:SlyX family protein [Alphaproteobacteria bacterium]
MNEEEIVTHIIEIETVIEHQQKAIDDLSEMVIKQGKLIDVLQKQNRLLQNMLNQDTVKPLSEETPPPHY